MWKAWKKIIPGPEAPKQQYLMNGFTSKYLYVELQENPKMPHVGFIAFSQKLVHLPSFTYMTGWHTQIVS
jgi:hypothetical protein